MSSPKPLIGCTTYWKEVPQTPPLEIIGLMPSYIEAVKAAGGIPVLIPLTLSDEDLLTVFARVDGLILPGGGDVEPALYQEEGTGLSKRINPQRDRGEILLTRTAVTQNKPLLAICRGIQVMNVALGGTLWEDLDTQRFDGLHHDWHGRQPRTHLAHAVQIDPDSRLAQSMGVTRPGVNSLHHQGIRDVAPKVAITATAPDGLVEGIEVPGHPFAVGVQWHPENLVFNDPHMLALFEGLVKASKQLAMNGNQ